MRDGRVLFEAAFPTAIPMAREISTPYTPTVPAWKRRRCDHGPDRHSAAELATGDLVFQTVAGLARFTSARAGQIELALAERTVCRAGGGTGNGRMAGRLPRGGRRTRTGSAAFRRASGAQPVKIVGPNAFQPVPVRIRPVPPYHPSSLGNREGANLLCLNSYVSKSQQIPAKLRCRSEGLVPK